MARIDTAPWVERHEVLPTIDSATLPKPGVALAEEVAELGLDPVREMAHFYVADYVLALVQTCKAKGANKANEAFAPMLHLRDDAKRLQDHTIARCDGAFQDYLFMAIGGEVRHHPAIRATKELGHTERTKSWRVWSEMAKTIGREQLTRDASEIFACDSWGGAYGGPKWKAIADVLLARLTGELDAKTFVDRVFSLQHNGGSALDKVQWHSSCQWHHHSFGHHYDDTPRTMATNPWHCVVIGNAHHNLGATFDGDSKENYYSTLLAVCDDDHAGLWRRLWSDASWIVPTDHKVGLGCALGHLETPDPEIDIWRIGHAIKALARVADVAEKQATQGDSFAGLTVPYSEYGAYSGNPNHYHLCPVSSTFSQSHEWTNGGKNISLCQACGLAVDLNA